MARVVLKNVRKVFDKDVVAVDNANIEILYDTDGTLMASAHSLIGADPITAVLADGRAIPDADGNFTTVHATFDNISVYEGERVRPAPGY